MGILKLKSDVTPREPVVLINDSSSKGSYAGTLPGLLDEPDWCGDLLVDVRLCTDSSVAAVGSQAFIMCWPDSYPTAWVNDPLPRQLGRRIGPNARVVESFRDTSAQYASLMRGGANDAIRYVVDVRVTRPPRVMTDPTPLGSSGQTPVASPSPRAPARERAGGRV
jgi:hypothetical protein